MVMSGEVEMSIFTGSGKNRSISSRMRRLDWMTMQNHMKEMKDYFAGCYIIRLLFTLSEESKSCCAEPVQNRAWRESVLE